MARKSNGLEKYALGMSNQVHGPSVLRSAAIKNKVQKENSGIDFTMLEPTKKKRKHAQVPITSASPYLPALASPPPRRIGLARFGYISSKSSSSSSSAPHQKP